MRRIDRQYYERRATDEMAAAGRAAAPEAAAAHRELARRYRRLCDEADDPAQLRADGEAERHEAL